MTCEACGDELAAEAFGRFHVRCVERLLRTSRTYWRSTPINPQTDHLFRSHQ